MSFTNFKGKLYTWREIEFLSPSGDKVWGGKMAEFVQFRIEEMIPELEEMERAGIFQRNEIK